jgi:flagellar biosynthesis GTPase FlhF
MACFGEADFIHLNNAPEKINYRSIGRGNGGAVIRNLIIRQDAAETGNSKLYEEELREQEKDRERDRRRQEESASRAAAEPAPEPEAPQEEEAAAEEPESTEENA